VLNNPAGISITSGRSDSRVFVPSPLPGTRLDEACYVHAIENSTSGKKAVKRVRLVDNDAVRWKPEEYRRYPLASLPRIRSCVRMAASNRSSRFLSACSAAKRAAPPERRMNSGHAEFTLPPLSVGVRRFRSGGLIYRRATGTGESVRGESKIKSHR